MKCDDGIQKYAKRIFVKSKIPKTSKYFFLKLFSLKNLLQANTISIKPEPKTYNPKNL